MFQPEEDSSFNLVWNIKHNLFALNLYSYVGTSNFCKEMLKSKIILASFFNFSSICLPIVALSFPFLNTVLVFENRLLKIVETKLEVS